MQPNLAFPTAALLLFFSCGPAPLSSSLPRQRVIPEAPDPPPIGRFIDFASDDAADYVVHDIDPIGEWRWTRDHPELQFRIPREKGLRLVLDFVISERTLKDTGPVTMTVSVNRVQVGVMRCGHEGEYHFERPVSVEAISESGVTLVTAEVNPVWVSPQDGAHLGYLIRRVGFRK